MCVYTFSQLNHAHKTPNATAILKQHPQDFIVKEQIAFPLAGEGEHVWCWVQKINQNSDWVAKQLAKFCNITNKEIGIAGKKDKHAQTYQWISCHLPQKTTPDFSKINIQGAKVLHTTRHTKKLQIGGLSGNNFIITLREVTGDKKQLEDNLQTIKEQGFANYFGEQRFGIEYANLAKATAFFNKKIKPKRHQKTMYLSAARSWIFNEILSARIKDNTWNKYQQGDVFQLQGSQKWFIDDGATNLSTRLSELDIHPTGALIGKGNSLTKNNILTLENNIINQHPIWQQGLAATGMKPDRRALRVIPKNLQWSWLDKTTLKLEFNLPAGSYATMLIRDVVKVEPVKQIV